MVEEVDELAFLFRVQSGPDLHSFGRISGIDLHNLGTLDGIESPGHGGMARPSGMARPRQRPARCCPAHSLVPAVPWPPC
jgi:hypothetical protein